MEHRAHIPALALLGLSFTGCPDDAQDPIVGDWVVSAFDGEKLPLLDTGYVDLYGMRMTVEDDLAGEFETYYEVDGDDYAYGVVHGTDLVVDVSAAPKYRVELVHDVLGGGGDYYYVSAGGADIGPAARPLAAPLRPDRAPAELVLTCTLDQDLLTCETDGDSPIPIVFKRKADPG